MGLGDPESRELETMDYPALMGFPNEKFGKNFFKIPRKIARNKSLVVHSAELNLRECTFV